MVNKKIFIMVNEINLLYAMWRKNNWGEWWGGVLKKFLLNVGFILSRYNGGKPCFSSYFDHIMI